VCLNSILPIDETWTIKSFTESFQGAKDILAANGLPNPDCPNETIEIQQLKSLQKQLDELGIDEDSEAYKKLTDTVTQITAIKSKLSDSLEANAIADLTGDAFALNQLFGVIPGVLTVPQHLVTDITPVDYSLQQAILEITPDESDPDSPTESLRIIRAILRTTQIYVPIATDTGSSSEGNWYWKPRGEVMFQVEGQQPMEIPCWPESVQDNTSATWSQEMTTYQHYEPQNTYKQSGPRTVSCTFVIHRAMWTGNQDDGNSERLVAYMQSACYPDYDKQSAEPPRVTLTIGNSIRIVGILTSLNTKFSGPIGPDTKYDCVDISVQITEESENVLSTSAVRNGLASWR